MNPAVLIIHSWRRCDFRVGDMAEEWHSNIFCKRDNVFFLRFTNSQLSFIKIKMKNKNESSDEQSEVEQLT